MTDRTRRQTGGGAAATPVATPTPQPPAPAAPQPPRPSTILRDEGRKWAKGVINSFLAPSPTQVRLRVIEAALCEVASATTVEEAADAMINGKVAVEAAIKFTDAIAGERANLREDLEEELAALAIGVLELLGVRMPTDNDREVARMNAAAEARRAAR